MPFKSNVFKKQIELHIEGTIKNELIQKSLDYQSLKTPRQKAHCIKEITEILDQNLDFESRRSIMEECGRQCIGKSILAKARQLQRHSANIDDLLAKLNSAHIGGSHFSRQESIISAQYDKCYCGSVNKSKELFSNTYCYCSCGWFKHLFETLLQKPVEIVLKNYILLGNNVCIFQIYL